MNKLGIVLGVTAVVTLAGCLDPNYKKPANRSQNEVKVVQPETGSKQSPEKAQETASIIPDVEIITVAENKCKCLPGTKHVKPCACGASDCACVVVPETKPVAPVEETTDYIVQRGDYLAKISKKYNLTIASIRRVNPQLKGDVIKVGQKIKLPGKIDVGSQKVPDGAFATSVKSPVQRSSYKAYDGKTKEYVVKSGDTLGAIAYSNGINIRQLKELNGMTTNKIRVGDKIKIPAEKPAADASQVSAQNEKSAKPVVTAAAVPVLATEKKSDVKPAVVKETVKTDDVSVSNDTHNASESVDPAPAADVSTKGDAKETKDPESAYITHVVQEGEDILSISLRYSVGPAVIRELNNLGDGDELKVNQTLRLPAETQL